MTLADDLRNAARSQVQTLALAYQRIPAATLNEMRKMEPLNYALLVGDEYAVKPPQRSSSAAARPATAGGCRRSDAPEIFAKWDTRRFQRGTTLQSALLAIEAANSATPVLHKLHLNFANGHILSYARSNPRDPTTLTASSVYDPSGAFVGTTAPRVEERREEKNGRLNFLVDDKGRALKPNPERKSSFHPDVLFRHSPSPGPNISTAYRFTPLSSITFQVRPSATITGCRPTIRETNPAAVGFRPRIVSRPASPIIYEPIDERNHSLTPALNGSVGRVRPRTATPSAGRPQTAATRHVTVAPAAAVAAAA